MLKKWALWWILKMVVSLWNGWGRMTPLHAFLLACLQTVPTPAIAAEMYVVYWVTLVVVGGNAAMMACSSA